MTSPISTSSTPASTQATTSAAASTQPATPTAAHEPSPEAVSKAIARRSYCTLATTSTSGRPHAAGVLYELAGRHLYVSTLRSSRKARNIATNPHVAVVIAVRRLPVGPPSSVHFQTTAEICSTDDRRIRELAEAGELSSITSHGELDLPDGCFVRIAVPDRLLTYGLGMPLRTLVRDPLGGSGATTFRPRAS